MTRVIGPGNMVGVLGSGQLGRMFAIAARRLGYRVATFSPDHDTPTGQIADLEITASYDDLDAVRRFADQVAVVTFEFENIPSATADLVAQRVPVRPAGRVLHVTQHRRREKTYLREHGFPVTPFEAVHSLEELSAALERLGTPAVLKTAGFGYDGKGQIKIATPAEAPAAWQALGSAEAVVERWVTFAQEASVVAARGLDGTIVDYGAVTNRHANHILDLTIAPGLLSEPLAREAREITHAVLATLEVVGVLCVEFFVTEEGTLLINELAPRPHNSGHFTFDASVTSQFEQQLRAICGLPLGSTELLRPAAMANLLGDGWSRGEPDWIAACGFPQVKLHLYGKAEARPGRKMGHLTALADSPEQAAAWVLAARRAAFREPEPASS